MHEIREFELSDLRIRGREKGKKSNEGAESRDSRERRDKSGDSGDKNGADSQDSLDFGAGREDLEGGESSGESFAPDWQREDSQGFLDSQDSRGGRETRSISRGASRDNFWNAADSRLEDSPRRDFLDSPRDFGESGGFGGESSGDFYGDSPLESSDNFSGSFFENAAQDSPQDSRAPQNYAQSPAQNPQNAKNPANAHIIGISLTTFLLFFALALFLFVAAHNIYVPRKLPSITIAKKDIAQRGTIYSADGYNIASSKKLYKVSVLKKSIDPDKMELFVRLFSIYSDLDEDYLSERLKDEGNIILSYKFGSKTALNLKQLNAKLLKHGVFRAYEENGRVMPKAGLSIELSGESREYLYGELAEPIIGYTNKLDTDGITKPSGVKGVEKFYDEAIKSKQDGLLEGGRDIGFNIILSKGAVLKERIDGQSVVLTIPLKLQKKIEAIIDEAAANLESKEIAVGVMESATGRILALSTNARFNPKHIKIDDYARLNPSFAEVSFEPGSIIKPIIYAILLEKHLVRPNEIFDTHNGFFMLGRYGIHDSVGYKYLSAENIIVQSSNVGMVQMAQRLGAKDYHNGLLAFGFSFPTDIDMPYEKNGLVPAQRLLNSPIYKGSVSYGYGIRATFLQMLRAYGAFALDGRLVSPYLRDYTLSQSGKKISQNTPNLGVKILSTYTLDTLQKTLIKTVEEGTAKQAKTAGIVVGGKTGTAKIAQDRRYGDKYISSFFGFAKDARASYTIGVVVFETSAKSVFYASQTATPIAKKIIDALVEEGYLKRGGA